MPARQIVFWGATGQAKVLRECVEQLDFRLIALFDNNPDVNSPFIDVPLYHGKEGFNEWASGRDFQSHPVYFLVAVGGHKGRDRLLLHEELVGAGLRAAVAVHPTAFVAQNVRIGEGSQVLARSSVCVDAVVGSSCIVNTGSVVEHDCVLQDGVHICPSATLAGEVLVEQCSMVGTGAIVLPRLRIGKEAIVGAGAVVTTDVSDYTVVAGNPARVVRSGTACCASVAGPDECRK